jgi:4-amino-4-deoxy-L-arabinose transferase-like glycosyltransferase
MREEHAFRWRYALLIVLVALAFRGAYVAEAAREPSWNLLYLDEEYHVGWARSLATQDWSAPYDQLRAAPYFRAPLYPYFLAGVFRLFGDGLFVPRLIQVLIGSLSCALAYALGAKCFDQRVGLITGLVCALYWVLAYHDAEFLLPVLLVFFVLLGFVLVFTAAERRSPWLAGLAGLAFGLFSITRPNILVFFPFAVWWGVVVAKRMSFRRGTAFVTLLALGMLVPPASVTVRNTVVGRDRVIVAWQNGVNFYIGNNPESDGMEAVVPGTRQTWWGGYDDTIAIAEAAAGRELKPSETSAYWFRRGLAYIRDEPIGWLRLTARKVVALVGAPEVPNNEPYEARRGNYAAFRLVPLSFAHLLGLFLASLPWMLARPGRRARAAAAGPQDLQRGFVLLVLAFLVSYGASVVAFFVTGRYRVPLVPFIAMGAAFAAVTLYDRVRQGRLVQAGALCVAAVALSWLLGVDHLHVREGTRDSAELSAAQDLLDTRDFGGAIRDLEAIRARGTLRIPELDKSLVRAYVGRNGPGDRAAAARVAEEAYALWPDDEEILWHATLAAFEREEWEAAAERASSFLSRRPDDLKALTVAFGAAMMLGRTDDMRGYLERAESVSPNDPAVARMRAGLSEPTRGQAP